MCFLCKFDMGSYRIKGGYVMVWVKNIRKRFKNCKVSCLQPQRRSGAKTRQWEALRWSMVSGN